MNNSLIPQRDNKLSLTLQDAIKSIKIENLNSVFDISDYRFKKEMLAALDDPRLVATDILKFATTSEAIIYLVLNKSGVEWRAMSENISIESALSQPSLFNLVSSDVVSQNRMILLLIRFLESLSKFFGSGTTQSAEELAWQIYSQFGHFSLEDFLIFSQKAKELAFTDKYQPITTQRGLTAEYILKWLQKYNAQREDARRGLVMRLRQS